jgi:DNA-directed RNA polymerase subunit F
MIKTNNINAKKMVELPELESKYFRTCKFGDWLFDTIPYGWRIYYKCSDIKRWFVSSYQRMRHGVADAECWSLDYTITKFVLPRLKHFKKMERYTYAPDLTPEEWEQIIDEIIWTFEYMDDEERFNPFPLMNDKNEDLKSYLNRERTSDEKEQMKQYLERCKTFEERRQKGLQLFAQHYHHLWD